MKQCVRAAHSLLNSIQWVSYRSYNTYQCARWIFLTALLRKTWLREKDQNLFECAKLVRNSKIRGWKTRTSTTHSHPLKFWNGNSAQSTRRNGLVQWHCKEFDEQNSKPIRRENVEHVISGYASCTESIRWPSAMQCNCLWHYITFIPLFIYSFEIHLSDF